MRLIFSIIALFTVSLFAGAAPTTVLDIAALKALAPGAYPTVQVLRYSTDTGFGYSGGGVVHWVSGSTKAAAACSVYVPNSNPTRGRWERPRSSFRTAAQCGNMNLEDTLTGVYTYPGLAGIGTRMMVVDSTGKASVQSIPAGGSLANPTGTIGLAAVNGSATSAMRSDGAPALSQAIAPTWSAQHIFTLAPRFNSVTASQVLMVDASKDLTSVATTGTGSFMRAGSPTTTGTLTADNITSTVLTGTGTRIVSATSGGVVGNALTFSGLYEFSNLINFAAGLAFSGNGTSAAGTVTRLADDGIQIRGLAGSTYDLSLMESGGSYLIRNPIGGTALEFPGSAIKMTALAGTGTRMVVADDDGDVTTQTIPEAGSLANPTGVIGLSAVNGSATSGMRSDGAPALSQAIVPTWTGKHTFTDSVVGVASRWTGNLAVTTITASGLIYTSGSGMQISGTASTQELFIYNSSATANRHSAVRLVTTNGNAYYTAGVDGPANYAWGARQADSLWVLVNGNGSVPNLTSSFELLVFSQLGTMTHRATASRPDTLTSSANITIDASLSNFYILTLAANTTLENPTNPTARAGGIRHLTVRVRQDGTGSRTMTYGSKFRFPGGLEPTLSTAANAIDYLSFIYDPTDDRWDFVGNAMNLMTPS